MHGNTIYSTRHHDLFFLLCTHDGAYRFPHWCEAPHISLHVLIYQVSFILSLSCMPFVPYQHQWNWSYLTEKLMSFQASFFFFFPLIYRRNYYNYSVQEQKESRTQAQLPVWWFSKYVKLIKDDAKKKRPNFKHRLDYCSNLSFNIPFQEYAIAIVMIRVEVC